ncbi:unnamed protein product [Absidia cylindrospora]
MSEVHHTLQKRPFLPNELVCLTLKYVDRGTLLICAQVSSQFYAAAVRYVWHTIHLNRPGVGIRFLQRLALVKHPVGQHIRSVSLHGLRWTDRTLLGMMKRTPYLEAITIDDGRKVTDASMQHVSRYWPHLKCLHLSQSPITQTSYQVLGQQCHALVKLTLDRCPFVQPTTSTFLVDFAGSELQALALAIAINDVDDDGALDHKEPWLANETTIDLTGLDRLTTLKLYGNPAGVFHRAVTTSMANGTCCWPRLTSIYMDECFDILDDDLISLLRLVPGLTHLTLKDGDFSDAVLDAIGPYNPNLIELDVSYNDQVTAKGIRRLVQRCLQLEWVTVSYCHIILDEAIHFDCYRPVASFGNTTRQHMGLDHLDKDALTVLRRRPDTYW